MPAIARSSTSVRIQQILLVTAKHFEIRPLPNAEPALPQGEFIDPLRFRWSDPPALPDRYQPVTQCPALSPATATCPA